MSEPSDISIPELAKLFGRPHRSVLRQLVRTHKKDQEERPDFAGWLFRPGRHGLRVNVSRLKLAHPEWFAVPSPQEMHSVIQEHTEEIGLLKKRFNALASAFREHRQTHDEAG